MAMKRGLYLLIIKLNTLKIQNYLIIIVLRIIKINLFKAIIYLVFFLQLAKKTIPMMVLHKNNSNRHNQIFLSFFQIKMTMQKLKKILVITIMKINNFHFQDCLLITMLKIIFMLFYNKDNHKIKKRKTI